MGIVLYMHTGHAYEVAESLTLTAVNDALDTNPDRFIEVPLAPNAATQPGTPGAGQNVLHLYITPASVSHFVVI